MGNDDSRQDLARLRRRAEARTLCLTADRRDLVGLSPEETSALVHELDVQRLELEMQNEELRQAQATLEVTRDRYSNLFDLAPVGYFSLDRRGHIQRVNITGAKLLGLDRGQLTPRPLQDFIVREDQDTFFRHLRRSFGRSQTDRFDLDMQRADGIPFSAHIEVATEPVVEEEGNCCLLVILDITERKRAEEALQEADRRKDEFLATLAHELRNPLAPISNALYLLDRPDLPEDTHRQARDMIGRQLQNMVRLIDDLLDVSRITCGKLQLRRDVVGLTAVLEQAVEAVRPQIKAAGHTLGMSLAAEPIDLHADRVRLTQILVNLLNNACAYTERGGEIRLNASCEGTQAAIRIADTGVGISPEDLPHLFEKFSRVGEESDRAHDGLGLGLWLTRNLVEMHGGSIEAKSGGLGKGCEFTVRLPAILDEVTEGSVKTAGAETEISAPVYRILVVDDNEDALASLAFLLSAEGHQVETASDGRAAVEAAAQFQPHVVLLDIVMPKLDGYAACRRIRALPSGKDLLIIALSGFGQNNDRHYTALAGFDAHLVKPVAPDAIMQLISERLADRM